METGNHQCSPLPSSRKRTRKQSEAPPEQTQESESLSAWKNSGDDAAERAHLESLRSQLDEMRSRLKQARIKEKMLKSQLKTMHQTRLKNASSSSGMRTSETTTTRRAPQDAMKELLATFQFPTTASDYEFSPLVLPEGNPYARAVRLAGVKQDWSSTNPKPNFLLTKLDKNIVHLDELDWDNNSNKISRTRSRIDSNQMFNPVERSQTCLVGATGTGKTRVLYEKCYAQFGVYVIADTSKHQPGSRDLSFFLNGLPKNPPMTKKECDEIRVAMGRYTRCLLCARAMVFQAALEACPTLEPRHWLALQLYPNRFVKRLNIKEEGDENELVVVQDVFLELVTLGTSLMTDFMDEYHMMGTEWRTARMNFVAFDETHVVDAMYSTTFGNKSNQSLLNILVTSIPEIYHLILCGNSLNLKHAYDDVNSIPSSNRVRLHGTTNVFDEVAFLDALTRCGVNGAHQFYGNVSRRFVGRPRFTMLLAEGLLMGVSPNEIARSIVEEFKNVLLPKLRRISRKNKSVYDEVRFAASKWELGGVGKILHGGEIAFEEGVCVLGALKPFSLSMFFMINEPLVIEAFELPPRE